jgi:hypothetical protein
MKAWTGAVPKVDDFGDKIDDEFIDGKTQTGPWGIMTPRSHRLHGVGLGLGKGQRFKKDAHNVWFDTTSDRQK